MTAPPVVRLSPLRRVLPLARSVRRRSATISFLSLEDLANEFVVRVAILDPNHARSAAAWSAAGFTARDQRCNAYQGEVVSAFDTLGGVDLAIVGWPGLDPSATMLELTFGPAAWGVCSLVPLDARGQCAARLPPDRLELSAESARVLELAEREALLMGAPVGPQHVLLSIVRNADCGDLRRTLEALNLHDERVRRLVATDLSEDSPRLRTFEGLSAIQTAEQTARRLGDVCIRPEHLLLGLLEDDASTVDRLLVRLGVPRPIVYGLVEAQLATRAESQVERAGRVARHVVAIGQTQTTGEHALTLMSVEDYATGFVVRGHLDSATLRLEDAIRMLNLRATDERGQAYMCERTAINGYSANDGCAVDVAWTSTRALNSLEETLSVTVIGVGRVFSVPLSSAVRVRHA